MKKISAVIISVLSVIVVFAAGISAERTLPLVVDNADLLTDSEEASLTRTLEQISESRKLEVAVVTVSSTGGKSAMAYADDFYDYNGYGYGANDDGVLLLIDMGEREWWITTHGLGQTYLTDYALVRIEDAFIDNLSDGSYYEAFEMFALKCDEHIASAMNGSTVTDGYYGDNYYYGDDYYYDHGYDYDSDDGGFSFSYLLPAIIIGFVVSFIMVSSMKRGMTTVRSASGATNYMVNGSLNLRSQSDRHLYSNTVRTKRDTGSHGSGRSGGYRGGSSSHRSSSGRSHGGRGGRF